MNRNKPITVVIADDHELVREGLLALLKKEPTIELQGIATNGAELVSIVKRYTPEVVLTDLKMPVLDGIAATKQIRDASPQTEVIALSMFDDESLILDVLDAGSIGYLLKNSGKAEIMQAIQMAAMHEQYYCREISLKLARYVSHTGLKKEPSVVFTEKELEVIRYICKEFTTEEIGKHMFYSKRTIDGYRSSIVHKMNVRGTAGIVVYAIQHGLYTLDAGN